MHKIRILIVEDHEVVRKGLAVLLEAEEDLEVVGEASNGEEAIAQALALLPEVVLMDLKLPGLDGVTASQRIKAACPQAKVLVLTGMEEDEYLFKALRRGVNGYLLKAIAPAELVRAIRAVYRGEPVFHPTAARKMLDRFSTGAMEERRQPFGGIQGKTVAQLTAREHQVLRLMATSATYREIADKLCVTEETVRKHAKSILHKLNQPDRTQAVLAALRAGLIELE